MEKEIIHIAIVDVFRDRSREQKRLIGETGKMLWRRGALLLVVLISLIIQPPYLHTMLVLNIKRVQSNFS